LIVLDPEGVERHRVEGFLPVDDFLAQLELGLAKLAFQQASYADAEKRFRSVCEGHARSGAALKSRRTGFRVAFASFSTASTSFVQRISLMEPSSVNTCSDVIRFGSLNDVLTRRGPLLTPT